MDHRLAKTVLQTLEEGKDAALRYAGKAREKLRDRDLSDLKTVVEYAKKAGSGLKTVKKVRAGVKKGMDKVGAVREKIPTAGDVRAAALGTWAKIAAFFAAILAGLRNPGPAEYAAFTAFFLSAAGSVAAIFRKKLRRLLPFFGALAALGTVILILRAVFPRRED